MTADEHVAMAETLLTQATVKSNDLDFRTRDSLIAFSQAHASVAIAKTLQEQRERSQA